MPGEKNKMEFFTLYEGISTERAFSSKFVYVQLPEPPSRFTIYVLHTHDCFCILPGDL